jgi:hypothetical protein
MAISPDTKDWTWVLERPCVECGFDSRAVDREHIAAILRDNASAWVGVLAAGDSETLTVRPSEERWSRLEYGCHVRDVFSRFDARLDLMLDTENPSFANWDQDATAISGRYDEQDPALVAIELLEAGNGLAGRFAAVTDHEWERVGTRSDGARFSVETLGRYLLHDIVHHLTDIGARAPAAGA